MRSYISVPCCSLIVMLGACGDGSATAGTDWDGTVTDSAGVSLVANTSTPTWGADDAWTTEEVLRIGEAAGDADYQFGQIAGIGISSDGRILVLDQQAQRVQVYGPDGVYQRSIGRPGNGPGEFGPAANSLFVGRGDTVIVPDLANTRVNVFPVDGESESFPIRMQEGVPVRFDHLEAGHLVAQLRSFNPNDENPANDVIASQAYDGTIIDTLMTPERGNTFSIANDRPQFRIFSPEPIWTALSGDRLAFAINNDFRVEVFGADGSLLQVITRPYEPTAVTEADERQLSTLIRAQFERGGVPGPQLDLLMEGVSFEETWPAFTQLRGGPEGTLWVQRVRYLRDLTDEQLESYNPTLDQGSFEWEVYDAEGRYLGVVALPDRFTPFTVHGDLWYGVQRDDFDVQYVVALRVGAGAGSD